MNQILRPPQYADPFSDPLDALLADIAISVQLPPGKHASVCKRRKLVEEHLNREGSPLRGLITRFYTQGSMAIDATISTRGTDDEYDIDLVVELGISELMTADVVLNALFGALKDYGVKVTRQTRCVTLHYADGMHIDVTPARRILYTPDFQSVIFHAKPGEPTYRHAFIPMNAFGFANWYNQRTPAEEYFSTVYNSRLLAMDQMLAKADPITHEIPEQTPLPLKSATTVALQLIKRFRNIWASARDVRYPPSVMLSCHAGLSTQPGLGLAQSVIRQALWTANAISRATAQHQLLHVCNPTMPTDVFTDRWPENFDQQLAFAKALNDFANGLARIRDFGIGLEEAQVSLREWFGPRVVSRSVDALNYRNGLAIASTTQGYLPGGRLYVPAAPAIIGVAATPRSVVSPRSHTNMGIRR